MIQPTALVNVFEVQQNRALQQTLPANTTDIPVGKSQPLSPGNIALSIFLFLFAGILEVGGGYLVWKGIREKYRPALCISMGFLTLCAYGLVPCLQPMDQFGRIFAVYGGFFIVLSYAWGYVVDGLILDVGDYVGTGIALAGVCIAWFWPRATAAL